MACGALAAGVGCHDRVVERPPPRRERVVYVQPAGPPPEQVVYVEGSPPPPPPVVVIPPPPGPEYVWFGPRYERDHGYYVLHHGEYRLRR